MISILQLGTIHNIYRQIQLDTQIEMTQRFGFILLFLSFSVVLLQGFYLPRCQLLHMVASKLFKGVEKTKLPFFSFLSPFEKDDNEKRRKEIEIENNKIELFPHSFSNKEEEKENTEEEDNRPLYTVVWYDCKECTELFHVLEEHHCKAVFLDLTECFKEYKDYGYDNPIEKPFFYKNEEYLGDDLFDFYTHLRQENIL